MLVERACSWAVGNPYPACGWNWYTVQLIKSDEKRSHEAPDWSSVQYHKIFNEGQHRIGVANPNWLHPDLRRKENENT